MLNQAIVMVIIWGLLTQKVFAYEAIGVDKTVNANTIAQQCYTAKWPEKALLDLAKQEFEIDNDGERHGLALQLLNCLANPKADIRDGVAFTGLSSWLRNDKLTRDLHQEMFITLLENFGAKTVDNAAVYQPFVALLLSELARVDRKQPYLAPQQRALLVAKSTDYMVNINDYRGFDDTVGWRHNVAHTADIFLQLALNPEITTEQLTAMLDAIGQQVLPDEHFYRYGEPKRLATALLYILLQQEHNTQNWQNWLQSYITPKPINDWQNTYISQVGLAKRHNASAFLSALFVIIADSNNEQLKQLKPALVESLKALN